MNKADINGKWALVTGASRGIGQQVSLGLAQYGCNLVLHSRNLEHTASLAKELISSGIQVYQVATELSDQQAVDKLAKKAQDFSGGIDILYNNAAVMPPFRSNWLKVPPDDFRLGFEINVITLVRLCHLLIPNMIDKHWGRIVNVSSGITNQPELIAYALTKAAVDKFVKDSVVRLKSTGVLMNLLDPGWLRTDMGGINAPNSVESVLPGALVPVLLNDETSGVLFHAQDYVNQVI
ncbi:MAG: SDR family oxidoreductase [Deltaproteobacteria bacterium]|nr:SDR family oxidoreductase [Deltaproteobacteria bacterium]